MRTRGLKASAPSPVKKQDATSRGRPGVRLVSPARIHLWTPPVVRILRASSGPTLGTTYLLLGSGDASFSRGLKWISDHKF